MQNLSAQNSVNTSTFKAVEVGGETDRVRPHVVDKKPVPHVQLREPVAVSYFVQAVAGWAPDDGGVSLLTAVYGLGKTQRLVMLGNSK